MKKIITAIMAFALLINTLSAKSPSTLVQEGNQAYLDKEYDIALEKYKSITDKDTLSTGHIDFNKANCLFKEGDFDGAIELYRQATNASSDKKLTASAKFNLGNSYFQKGQTIEKEKPKEAIEDYQQSARFYRQALDINKSDIEAAQNIALTRKKINELKEIIKQQKQQQQQQDQNKEQEQEKQQDQQNQQNNNNQNKQQNEKNKQDQQTGQNQGSGNSGSEQQQSENQQKQNQEQQEQEQSQEQKLAQQDDDDQQEQAEQTTKDIQQKPEIDPQAVRIIEDEKKRKEQRIQIMRVQQKPAEKDW